LRAPNLCGNRPLHPVSQEGSDNIWICLVCPSLLIPSFRLFLSLVPPRCCFSLPPACGGSLEAGVQKSTCVGQAVSPYPPLVLGATGFFSLYRLPHCESCKMPLFLGFFILFLLFSPPPVPHDQSHAFVSPFNSEDRLTFQQVRHFSNSSCERRSSSVVRFVLVQFLPLSTSPNYTRWK